jgi:hypothetical protein
VVVRYPAVLNEQNSRWNDPVTQPESEKGEWTVAD